MPAAFALFPKDISSPSKNLQKDFLMFNNREMPKAGHFAAMEQPELLADHIRKFANDKLVNKELRIMSYE